MIDYDEPSGEIFVDFQYQDEYGNETSMSKTVPSNYMSQKGELGPLCALFKDFLLAVGFDYLAGQHIEFVEGEE